MDASAGRAVPRGAESEGSRVQPAAGSSSDERVRRLVQWYETLTPQTLREVETLYAPAARFKDPFNEVAGPQAVRGIFEHMFRTVREPRFVVHLAVVQGNDCFLTWDFLFRFQGRDTSLQQVRGATHLRFDEQGRVALHRDYWDAAEELYEKLPLLGGFMRWLKRRAAS